MEVMYAPDFEDDLVGLGARSYEHATSPSPIPSAFSYIPPNCTPSQMVTRINDNNSFFNTNITGLWEALTRQQSVHGAFKEEA